MDDTPQSLDVVVNSETQDPASTVILGATKLVSHVAGTLLSAFSGYQCFLLEIYIKHVIAEPDFALNALTHSYAASSDAVPYTLSDFVDSNVVLAQQSPEAVAVGVAGFIAFYALFRVMHSAIFDNASIPHTQPQPASYLVK